jgi:WD40 repeat protein
MNKLYTIPCVLVYFCTLFGQADHKDILVIKDHLVVASLYSPDGRYLASAGSDGRILIRDTRTGEIYRELNGLQHLPLAVSFSSKGEYLVSGGRDKMVTIWDISSGLPVRHLSGHSGHVTSVSLAPDNRLIASGSTDKTIRVWDFETGDNLLTLEGQKGEITKIDFHPNGEMLAAGSNEGEIAVWNIISGELVISESRGSGTVSALKYSPNGNFIASSGNSSSISIWNAYNLALENMILVHTDIVGDLCYSPDGRYIVSGGDDRFVVISEINSGGISFHSGLQGYPVTSVAISPDGKELISASMYSDTLKTWNISGLNIEPAILASHDVLSLPVPKPEIRWITLNDHESIGPGYSVKYMIRSGSPVERMNLHVNNEPHIIKTNLDLESDQWVDAEDRIFLKEGDNQVQIDLFYSRGMVRSEILNIRYRTETLEELISKYMTRTIRVLLRETDEYEVSVTGAEGYLFHNEKINVPDTEGEEIDVELAPLREDVAIVLNNITFATNSADLTIESFNELDRVVELLLTNPRIIIEISAHTCDIGTDAYNLLLSDRRSQSVVNYLLDNNVDATRLVAKGYGSGSPLMPNTSEENRALNRRVEFKIIEFTDQNNQDITDELY